MVAEAETPQRRGDEHYFSVYHHTHIRLTDVFHVSLG